MWHGLLLYLLALAGSSGCTRIPLVCHYPFRVTSPASIGFVKAVAWTGPADVAGQAVEVSVPRRRFRFFRRGLSGLPVVASRSSLLLAISSETLCPWTLNSILS